MVEGTIQLAEFCYYLGASDRYRNRRFILHHTERGGSCILAFLAHTYRVAMVEKPTVCPQYPRYRLTVWHVIFAERGVGWPKTWQCKSLFEGQRTRWTGWDVMFRKAGTQLPRISNAQSTIRTSPSINTLTQDNNSRTHSIQPTSNPTTTKQTRSIMSSTIHVKGISSQTSEKEVRDFFSFW